MAQIDLFNRNAFFHAQLMASQVSGESDIAVDSVFWGDPEGLWSVDRSIILDTNVFNFIRQKPTHSAVQALVAHSRTQGLFLDPSFALFEQRLRHGNPQGAMQQFVKSLADNFSLHITATNVAAMEAYLSVAAERIRPNVELFKIYLPMVKLIWNSSGTFTAKVDRLASAIRTKDLPRFLFAYLFAVVAFYVKEHPTKFSQAIQAKVQSDMAVSSNPSKEQDKLWNVAFDVSLFAFCIDVAVREQTPAILYLSKIASADATFQAFCRNIKACAIQTRLPGGVPNGLWGIVPDADLDAAASAHAMEQFPKSLPPSPLIVGDRLARLQKISSDIVNEVPTGI